MTTATNWRKERGMQAQKWVAEWYARLWPGADTQGSGRSGRDVTGVPVDIEVKSRKGFEPLAAIKQLKSRPPGEFGPGWIVMRMDGQGEASIPDFLVLMTLADHTAYIEEVARLRSEMTGRREEAQSAVRLVRDILKALAVQRGISLESEAEPGTSARNYEVADRLGIGHVFGLRRG